MVNNKSIGILDFKVNNIASVYNCLSKIQNLKIKIISNENDLKNLNHLIIPGVGSFKAGIENLKKLNLFNKVSDFINKKENYLLGICLGAQLFFENSEEDFKINDGLKLFKGSCKKLYTNSENVKIPHMGWNQVKIVKKSNISKNIPNIFYAYFVHSYYLDATNKDYILGKTLHGVNFPSIIGDENKFGIQFHPEKSGQIGFQFLKNFVEL